MSRPFRHCVNFTVSRESRTRSGGDTLRRIHCERFLFAHFMLVSSAGPWRFQVRRLGGGTGTLLSLLSFRVPARDAEAGNKGFGPREWRLIASADEGSGNENAGSTVAE
jgi:hypothetical protein